MKNKLIYYSITILMFISIVGLISATTIYSGDTINLPLDKPYVYYSIVGNSTEILLDITQEGNNITIIFDKYMKDDSFEIVFFDIEKEVITIYQSSGEGGGGTRTITKEVIKEVEVPNYITQYEENKTIEYIDNEIIVEKDVTMFVFIIICSFILIMFLVYLLYPKKKINELNSKEDIGERGYEENE